MTESKAEGPLASPADTAGLVIPHLLFSTRNLAERDRHGAYRDLVSVSLDASDPQDAFFADLQSWRMDRMVLTHSSHGAQTFARAAQRLRQDDLDHYVLQVAQSGSLHADADGAEISAGPGEIMLFDLTRPMRLRTSAVEVVTLSVARSIIASAVGERDAHGVVLKGAHAGLLADVLAAVTSRLPHMNRTTLPGVTASLGGLITSAVAVELNTSATGEESERALLITAQTYIEQHLGSRRLTPESVGVALGVSRTKLYRLFEPLGGVSQYIWGRRLEQARAVLTNPNSTTRVSQLSFGLGFASEAHFSRAFRARYGMSATEMLARHRRPGPPGEAPEGGLAQTFAGWIGALK